MTAAAGDVADLLDAVLDSDPADVRAGADQRAEGSGVQFHGGEQLVASLAVQRSGPGRVVDEFAQVFGVASGADLVDGFHADPV